MEGISVVIRRDAIDAKHPGGWHEFLRDVPNKTICADEYLAAVRFMNPQAVEAYVEFLATHGLELVRNGSAEDLVIVDQLEGPTLPCSWAEVGIVTIAVNPPQRISVCWQVGDASKLVASPEGWKFAESLSHKHLFVPSEELRDKLILTREEGDLDVYVDPSSGEELFVASARPVWRLTTRSS